MNQEARHAGLAGWQTFSAAPHRLMFFGGMLQLVLVMSWWLAELLTRAQLVAPLSLAIPAIWAHALFMLYAVFPFFMFGFLLTVYPRWLSTAPIARDVYVPIFASFVAGGLLLHPALLWSRALLIAAMLLMLIGWGLALRALLRVYFASAAAERLHTRTLNLALILGWLGLLATATAVAFNMPTSFLVAREVGLWLFLLPVVFAVSHRMIPFFSSSVLENYTMTRPPWSVPLLFTLAAGHALLEFTGQGAWLFLVDLPLFVLVLYHTLAWGFFRSFSVRLLAMLHIAFLWLSVGLALYTVQSLVLMLTGNVILGRAPLHALGIGFVTSITVAMVTRVSLGHSGRPLVADDLSWAVLLGINLAALLRIAAELPIPASVASALNIAAAVAWLVALLPWVWRYLPMYLRPRIDGKPG